MTRQLMLADLRRSGLTKTDAQQLKCKVLSRKAVKALTNLDAAGYQLPYFTLAGKPNGFWRVRLLDEVIRKGKLVRYTQPADAPPQLYLPPIVPWATIKASTKVPIWFTEGEKKAAKACKEALPCIGLGGVWNWRSSKHRLTLIPVFNDFNWQDREVVLCFDSDFSTNPNVNAAMHALARELFRLGADVAFKELPHGDEDEKVGLDDYLLDHTVTELRELPTEPFLEGMKLLQLNNELTMIENPAGIMHLASKVLHASPQPLTKMLYANRTFPKVLESGKLKEVNAVDEWIKSNFRRQHTGITYEPGLHRDSTDNNEYNLWEGWGVEPKKGSAKPFVDLIEYMTSSSEPAVRQWFLQWLAYPLQHPGTKLYTSVLLMSKEQGTGKSLIGYTMGRIYGKNFAQIGKADLTGAFNKWAHNRQFVLGEEITGSDKRHEADKIKNLVTQDFVTINAKYQKEYTIPDCINYLFTSNHVDALFLEDRDRRFMVIELFKKPLDMPFYRAYDQWYREDGGTSYVFNYLLNVDLTGFRSMDRAPFTDAKERMTQINKLDVDIWARMVLDDPAEALSGSASVMWTPQELLELLNGAMARSRYTVNIRQISTALANVGIIPNNIRVKQPDGTTLQKRVYALQQRDKWEAIRYRPVEWGKQYTKERAMLTKQASQEY